MTSINISLNMFILLIWLLISTWGSGYYRNRSKDSNYMSFDKRVSPESFSYEIEDWTKEYHVKEMERKLEEEKREIQRNAVTEKLDTNYQLVCKQDLGFTSDSSCTPKRRQEDFDMYNKIRKEVEQEFIVPPEPMDYRSVTRVDYHTQVLSEKPRPEPNLCALANDQPVTFWTEYRDRMHGMTQNGVNRPTPFGKNSSFTTPIEQYLNGPMPGETYSYPR